MIGAAGTLKPPERDPAWPAASPATLRWHPSFLPRLLNRSGLDGGAINRPSARHGPREVGNQPRLLRAINAATDVAAFANYRVRDLGDRRSSALALSMDLIGKSSAPLPWPSAATAPSPAPSSAPPPRTAIDIVYIATPTAAPAT